MKLYKYLHSDRIDILENWHISFTPPPRFNDPFDMNPNLLGFMSREYAQTRLFERFCSPDGQKAWLKNPMCPDAFKEPAFLLQMRSYWPNGFEQFFPAINLDQALTKGVWGGQSPELGVLCLTEHPLNLLMWAHYAVNHEGYVIEFESTHPFFARSAYRDGLGELREVTYSKDRPAKYVLDMESTLQDYYTKGLEWSQEDEWRMFLRLTHAAKTIATPKGPIFLFPLPQDCVTGVFIGARCSMANGGRIVSLLQASASTRHVEINVVQLHESEYRLVLKHLGRPHDVQAPDVVELLRPPARPVPPKEIIEDMRRVEARNPDKFDP